MSELHLTGLEGTNPLGFLAALGVQAAFALQSNDDEVPTQLRVWWSDDIIPHAVVDDDVNVTRIADHVLHAFRQWHDSPALNPRRPDGSAMPKGDELKLLPPDMRTYLGQSHRQQPAAALITSLLAEGSLDKQDIAKPSDLYFTAGQQKFLAMARDILSGAARADVLAGIEGPWNYAGTLPSLGWDVSDDRSYALRSTNPAKEDKPSNPGPEALAVMGLSLHPVFASRGRTLTQGCSGSWKNGYYSWPLWRKPASSNAVRSLLAHAVHDPTATDRQRWFRSWGVFRILRSPIRRSKQGGYGTFGPPEVAWQAS